MRTKEERYGRWTIAYRGMRNGWCVLLRPGRFGKEQEWIGGERTRESLVHWLDSLDAARQQREEG